MRPLIPVLMLLLLGCQPAPMPPAWQAVQQRLDPLVVPQPHDGVYQQSDALLATAFDAVLLSSQCESPQASQLQDYHRALFAANDVARKLNLVQITLLLEDNRRRSDGQPTLLLASERTRINGFHTFDDGLLINPVDLDSQLLRQVQQRHPQHPVAQMQFGAVPLEQRFRLLAHYWQALARYPQGQPPRCDQLPGLLGQLVKHS